jgi:hypothetical protein
MELEETNQSPAKHTIQIARVEQDLAPLDQRAWIPPLYGDLLLDDVRLCATLQTDYIGRVVQSMGQGCDFRTRAYLQEGPTIDVFAGRSELGADVVCCKAVPWCRREEGHVNFHLLSVRHRRPDESKKAVPLQLVSTRS